MDEFRTDEGREEDGEAVADKRAVSGDLHYFLRDLENQAKDEKEGELHRDKPIESSFVAEATFQSGARDRHATGGSMKSTNNNINSSRRREGKQRP